MFLCSLLVVKALLCWSSAVLQKYTTMHEHDVWSMLMLTHPEKGMFFEILVPRASYLHTSV